MTDTALHITARELKELAALAEHSCAIGPELRTQLQTIANNVSLDVTLISRTTYPVMLTISKDYIAQTLQKHNIDPTDENIQMLAEEAETRIADKCLGSAKNVLPAVIREYLDYDKFVPSTKSITSKILKIMNGLDGQIRQLKAITENPEQYEPKQVEEATERLFAARESNRHWSNLYHTQIDKKGCLADALGAIPIKTPIHKAYAIYLKTYKTEV